MCAFMHAAMIYSSKKGCNENMRKCGIDGQTCGIISV